MHRHDLIRMANQVAQFFETSPQELGAAEIAKHLQSFWDPRMRRQLQDYARQTEDDLHPLVRMALSRLESPTSSGAGLRADGRFDDVITAGTEAGATENGRI